MRFYSYTEFGNRLIESYSKPISARFIDTNITDNDNKIIIVTPHPTDTTNIWREIYSAWEKIQSFNTDNDMKAWRTILKYGDPIIAGQRLFKLKNNYSKSFFYLLDKTNFYEASNHLFDIFEILCSLKHINNNRNFLHAASVFRDNYAHLLLGHSGAGKSTASEYSLKKGYSVLHDDHIVVFKSEKKCYMVTNNTLYSEIIPLKFLIFLVQDKKDYLVPLSPIETAKKIMNSCYESFANPLLYGQYLKTVFNISTGMAHSIPGYELHFRKSPDFWDMIDEELKN